MATTLATFYNTYKNLALSNIDSLDRPPTLSELSGKVPCKWVDLAGLDEEPLRKGSPGGDRTLRCRLVVAIAPLGQSTQSSRWSDTLAMVDTVNTGIKSVADDTTTWSVEAVPNFWDWGFAVTATLESNEWTV